MEQATLDPLVDKRTRKPPHESLVDLIIVARFPTELTLLGTFVIQSSIPEGHAELRKAWVKKCEELNYDPNFGGQVLADIDLQEQEIARQAPSSERQQDRLGTDGVCGSLTDVCDEGQPTCQP